MRIVFMGTPDFAVVCLKRLIDDGHDIAAVVTQPDKAKGRGKKIQFTPVKELALTENIKVMQPDKIKENREFYDELYTLAPDIIVVVAYGKLIPKAILDLPRFGAINVHASLLPKLRGASPIQNAIVLGEERTGVTIMQMGEGLDTGDMLTSSEVEIGRMNYEELHDRLADMGADLLSDTLPLIEAGRLTPVKQDDGISTYAGIIRKQDGKLDFSKEPETQERIIRGFDPWPGAFCEYEDMTMKLWKAEPDSLRGLEEASAYGEIIDVRGDSFTVRCGSGVLTVYEIQIPGKKRVKVSDYLLGNEIKKGIILK